ncbi:DUF397 domain-containing protein [Streptomyces sp. NPDC058086]|uniref:DUF397 domain-containing protein n=1 Tax=Streptomyces sp. NPDC058086 TaxID=3346334 RepID=UPI0036E8C82E
MAWAARSGCRSIATNTAQPSQVWKGAGRWRLGGGGAAGRGGGGSNHGPECVEIAIAPAATVHVRDSKDTQRAQLAFTGASWTEFVSSVRR